MPPCPARPRVCRCRARHTLLPGQWLAAVCDRGRARGKGAAECASSASRRQRRLSQRTLPALPELATSRWPTRWPTHIALRAVKWRWACDRPTELNVHHAIRYGGAGQWTDADSSPPLTSAFAEAGQACNHRPSAEWAVSCPVAAHSQVGSGRISNSRITSNKIWPWVAGCIHDTIRCTSAQPGGQAKQGCD